MHDIEPYYRWRQYYVASEDIESPYYGMQYDEFKFTDKIYNYFIHPQWDNFGSHTLYVKVLFVDYEEHIAMLELIGEWNDAIGNDIMFLKRKLADKLIDKGVYKFILLCDNVLNFHHSDDCYYEEWWEEVSDEEGWICCVNLFDHVMKEMEQVCVQHYLHFGEHLNDINWRLEHPQNAIDKISTQLYKGIKQLR